jgi:hypothetical protein
MNARVRIESNGLADAFTSVPRIHRTAIEQAPVAGDHE